jgi:hypothetical protein
VDGKRIREYWSNEMQALLDTYKQFQVLIPAKNRNGADHNGEDGRYVETLIREYLKRYLPKDLEVLTGFILRPAVKTGLKNKCRQDQQDMHSTQLDIIVYDSANYEFNFLSISTQFTFNVGWVDFLYSIPTK